MSYVDAVAFSVDCGNGTCAGEKDRMNMEALCCSAIIE